MALCEATSAKFILPAGLDPKNYVMTNSLGDIRRWRAKVYKANSGGKVGAMDTVGYVMISRKDNTIVPIASGDEHHTGFDVLQYLARRHKFDVKNYVPVWAYGRNFIYDKSDVPILLQAFKKYLAYGGIDGPLKGTSEYHGKVVMISYFVEHHGDMTIAPHELAPIGKMIVNGLQSLAQAVQAANASTQRSVRAKAFVAAETFLRHLDALIPFELRDIKDEQVQKALGSIRELKAADDVDGLEQLLFGFHGIKNEMHNALRAAQKRMQNGTPDYEDSDRKGTWGDIDLAVDMLGRM